MAQNSEKTVKTRRRGAGRPFAKGDSRINIGGRPKKDIVLAEAAREHTAEALGTLVELMRDSDNDSTRRAAASELLDRGWGRAPQTINLGGGVKLHYKLDGVSKEEQVALTRRLMALRMEGNN